MQKNTEERSWTNCECASNLNILSIETWFVCQIANLTLYRRVSPSLSLSLSLYKFDTFVTTNNSASQLGSFKFLPDGPEAFANRDGKVPAVESNQELQCKQEWICSLHLHWQRFPNDDCWTRSGDQLPIFGSSAGMFQGVRVSEGSGDLRKESKMNFWYHVDIWNLLRMFDMSF